MANYRGWMFIGFSRDYRVGQVKQRTFMNEECLVFRTEAGALSMVEPYCSHFGVNMATGRVRKECIQCPMHGRLFRGDGRGASPKHRPIRAYPVDEHGGLAFAYFDHAGVEPQWGAPRLITDECPDVLWHHKRMLSLHHPSVPLDNSVDPRHFQFTHKIFGKHTVDGEFTPDGHRALGTMATTLAAPLAALAGGAESKVTTWFDSPLNTHLRSEVKGNASDLLNLLTIVEGKKCLLTQIGIGKRSRRPIELFNNAVAFAGSWYATYEDLPVWNNRRPQPLDNDAHQTDRALEDFREWFETFAYEPGQALAPPPREELESTSRNEGPSC